MSFSIKVTPTHYENLCRECQDREAGELTELTTTAGKPYYEPVCEPLPTSPCKLKLSDTDEDEAKQANEHKGESRQDTRSGRRRRRR